MNMDALKLRWAELEKRYLALSLREQVLVAVAVWVGVAYLGGMLWVSPMFARAQGYARQAAQQEKELAGLRDQLQTLRNQTSQDPNAPLQVELANAEKQLKSLDDRLAGFEKALIPPERMPQMLEGLLRQARGVRLLNLKTLPVEALTLKQREGLPETADKGAAAISVLPGIYRHGFEMQIEGGYLELMAYLEVLEKQPQQLLWQRASLSVGKYPDAVLSLTVFTLSQEKGWLAL